MNMPLPQVTVGPREHRGVPRLPNDTGPLDSMMTAFYVEVDAAIAARKPVCVNRGDCCKLDSFGHRMFVTDVELAYFTQGVHHRWRSPDGSGSCPYQQEGRCTAREHRPLGCRIFFCDPQARAWQGPEYERRLAELKGIGEKLGFAYRYREWLSALSETERRPSADLPTSVDGQARKGVE